MDLFCRAKYNGKTIALIIFEDRMSQNTETEKPINFDEIRLDLFRIYIRKTTRNLLLL